jgi:hypothetical protein
MGRPRKRDAMGALPGMGYSDPTHAENPKSLELAVACVESAAATLGTIAPGFSRFMLTKGQFSMLDLLQAILNQTGPANVVISTWTTGIRDAEAVAFLRDSKLIADLRFLIDYGLETRKPNALEIERTLGRECVTSCKTHAKFMMIRNERWSIVAHGSLNLNRNLRWENIHAMDSLPLWQFFAEVVNELAALTPPGIVGIASGAVTPVMHTAAESHPNRVYEANAPAPAPQIAAAHEADGAAPQDETPAKVRELAALGYSRDEVAARLGVALDGALADAFRQGALDIEDTIRRAVINRAAAGDDKARARALKWIAEQNKPAGGEPKWKPRNRMD